MREPSLDHYENFSEHEKKRFWSKVKRGPGCWIFQDATPKIKMRGTMLKAPRIAWRLYYGKSPGKLLVCHTCDNPFCVRKKHLFLGTHTDNNADMVQKGRNRPPKGTAHHDAKFTPNLVRKIRNSPLTDLELSFKYRVSSGTIWKIRKRRTWKHVA